MNTAEFERYDGLGLADLVRRARGDARRAARRRVARVEAAQPGGERGDHCACTTRPRARSPPGLPTGPFTGVPFLMKDLGAPYAGDVSSLGAVLRGHPPWFTTARSQRGSSAPARHLRQDQHARVRPGRLTEPHLYGPTRNPWNLDAHARRLERRLGGGGGRGHGADRARQRRRRLHPHPRRPAAASSASSPPGAASLGAGTGEGWGGAPVEHAVTRSVRDSAALLDATARPGPATPTRRRRPPALPRGGRAAPRHAAHRLHHARPNGPPSTPNAPRPRRTGAALRAARPPRGGGPPGIEAKVRRDVHHLVSADVRASLEARPAALGRELSRALRAPDLGARHGGHTARAADYARSIGVIHRTGRIVGRFFTRYDILLSPTMCQPPYPLGVLDMMTDDIEPYTRAILGAIGFTSLFNQAGTPAMSVPLAGPGPACPSASSSPRPTETKPPSSAWAPSSRRRSPGRDDVFPSRHQGDSHERARPPGASRRRQGRAPLPPRLRPDHGRAGPHRAPRGPDAGLGRRRARPAQGRRVHAHEARRAAGCSRSSGGTRPTLLNPALRDRHQGPGRLPDLLRAAGGLRPRRQHGPGARRRRSRAVQNGGVAKDGHVGHVEAQEAACTGTTASRSPPTTWSSPRSSCPTPPPPRRPAAYYEIVEASTSVDCHTVKFDFNKPHAVLGRRLLRHRG